MNKYSLKNIALGIGIGLIISAFANINAGQRQLTVEEFKREADRLGYYVIDMQEMIKKNPDGINNGAGLDQPGGEEKTTPTPTPIATPALTPTPTPEIAEVVELFIKRGSISDTVAEDLFQKKLIESKKEFLNKLYAARKQNSLQVGRFLIRRGVSIEEIIKILTSRPNG